MRRLQIPLEKCKPGDIIATTIIDIRSGVVLCSPGHIVTRETLDWLNKFMCSDIYIVPDSHKKLWTLDPSLSQAYDTNTQKISTLLDELKINKPISRKCVTDISTDFFTTLNTNTTIMGCINKIKSIDEYTYMHCMNVGMLAVLIGKWLNFSSERLEKLFLAGILCDIGKGKVDPKILSKPGPLTKEEYDLAKEHVNYSYESVKGFEDIDEEILEGIMTHHERHDGSGYPKGLKGDEIPLFGKILAIADSFDAMTSNRVYKPKMTPFLAMEHFTTRDFEKYDTKILMTFLGNIAHYYIGVYVRINTGQVGEVVFINPSCTYKPIVKVSDDYIDLLRLRHVYICEIL